MVGPSGANGGPVLVLKKHTKVSPAYETLGQHRMVAAPEPSPTLTGLAPLGLTADCSRACEQVGLAPGVYAPAVNHVSPDPALPSGSTLNKGRYSLGRKVGEGGFGAVYAAVDHTTGTDVAVKVGQGGSRGSGVCAWCGYQQRCGSHDC
jgi:hypothetical protein